MPRSGRAPNIATVAVRVERGSQRPRVRLPYLECLHMVAPFLHRLRARDFLRRRRRIDGSVTMPLRFRPCWRREKWVSFRPRRTAARGMSWLWSWLSLSSSWVMSARLLRPRY